MTMYVNWMLNKNLNFGIIYLWKVHEENIYFNHNQYGLYILCLYLLYVNMPIYIYNHYQET